MLNKNNLKDIYSLTPLQEGMLFHSQFNSDSSAYIEQTDLLIEGRFNPEIFKKSWQLITQKYDAFRSLFITKKADKPLQVIMKELNFDFKIENISQLTSLEKQQALNQFRQKDIKTGFNLSQGPLFRLAIFDLGQQQYQVIWTFHHIIMDGWSLGVILNDLFAFYKNLLAQQNVEILDAPNYSVFVQWLASRDQYEGLKYWKTYLTGIEKQTKIPQKLEINEKGFKLTKHAKSISKTDTDRLKQFAKENGLTLNTIVQTLWAGCLNRWSGEDTVVFGTTVSGRQADVKNIEKMVGLFINTIPIKVNFQEDKTFLELATQFQKSFAESERYSYCSLANIQNESSLKSDLINHLVVFENYPLEEMQEKLGALGFKIKEIGGFEHTNYDFEVVVIPQETLDLEIKCNENKYDQDLIEDVLSHFEHLCQAVFLNQNMTFNQINMVIPAVQKKLIFDVNQTWDLSKKQFPSDTSVVAMFEQQVLLNPSGIALHVNTRVVTYLELSRLVNNISSHLINRFQMQKGQFIAVLAERNEFAIALFFGVLKAGGAYIPIDPIYPQEKADFMLRDSGAKLLVIADEFSKRTFTEYNGNTVLMSNLVEETSPNLIDYSTSSSCAYIIYTSGSTGLPKGCMISNHNLSSLIIDAVVAYDFNKNDVWITSHSFCFDFSIWEIYGALCYGGSLVLPSLEEVKDTSKFLDLLSNHHVTILNQTPPSFYRLIEEDAQSKKGNALSAIRFVIFGGDRLDMKPLQSWVKKYPLDKTALVNMFGITETTVHVTYRKLLTDDIFNQSGQSPIGTAIPEYSVVLLDHKKRITPFGVVGEIYVGGTGVAIGYLNRPELTAARFIQNPFNSKERLYRSGDIAIRQKNGNLLYLGRNDDQVQLRGFRVELGEISHRLEMHPMIKDAFVLPIKDGERDDRLVGFYTLKDKIEPSRQELEEWLSQTLAEYMVPKQLYCILKFPLTQNGKIDRNALRKLESNLISNTIADDFIAPRNDLETKMAKIWCQILEIEKIGITSNFFALGGHSIKATQLASSMAKNLNIQFSLKEIFESPTIEKLSYYAQFKKPSIYARINNCKTQDYYEVSHAQKRLWLIDKVSGPTAAYHIQGSFELIGAVDCERLEKALNQIVMRHESLRTNFVDIDDKPFQVIRENVLLPINKYLISNVVEIKQDILKNNEKPFNLENDLLLRVDLYEISKTSFVFSVCIHHIISDGWSVGVFVNELSKIYNDEKLEPLLIQYKDFTYWQNEAIHHSASMNSQRDFWAKQLEGELPALDLPIDFVRPEKRNGEGDSYHFELSAAVTKELKAYLEANQYSLFLGLFSFYNILLHKYTHQNDLIVGFPVSGRYHHDLNNQVGYYLNTLPLRTQIDPQNSVESFLKLMDENIKNAFDNQVYPFDLLLETHNKGRGADRVGLYDVMFTLQNFDEGKLSLGPFSVKPFVVDLPNSKFEMTMICKESNGVIEVSIEYSTQLFSRNRIQNFSQHFIHLIGDFLKSKKKSIAELSLLNELGLKKVTQEFNAHQLNESSIKISNKGVIDLFYETVDENPNAVALVNNHQILTYQELDKRSNQIANYLISEVGLKKESTVGIFYSKNCEMIAAILGIMKAGCVYVPVDSNNPESRIKFLYEDSKCSLVFTEEQLLQNIKNLHPKIINSALIGNNSVRPKVNYSQNDLAYIMYTSGSTGVPKGVMIENRSIVSLVRNTNYSQILPSDHILQLSNYAFDGCIFDIFGALLNGASLYLINDEDQSLPENLCAYIRKNKINKTFITTALFNVLIDYQPEIIRQFDKIYFGGQEASIQHVHKALGFRKNKDSIVHVYGPTETTTFSSYFIVDSIENEKQSLAIGKPVSNDQIYILDAQKMPVPIGINGEIYISGKGVARGYLNRPEQNEKSFLRNPFGGDYPLYKTNDLGRWDENGNIHYLGRNDQQIKIRGYRVELGDVISSIAKFPGILQVFATTFSKGQGANVELVGYYVGSQAISQNDLRSFLLKSIPSYMIPAFLFQVEQFPLNKNGKIDKSQLPKPGENEANVAQISKPQSKIELMLYEIWSQLLSRKNIGVSDNYFSLGGDSIKAIQMISSLREKGYKLSIKDLYKKPTIAELVNCLVSSVQVNSQEKIVGDVPLGAIQQWFFETKEKPHHHFNQDLLLEIANAIDNKTIQQSLALLVQQHDMLRAVFAISGSLPKQNVLEALSPTIEEVTIANESEIESITTALNQKLNLEAGPLLRCLWVKSAKQNYLYLVIHHLVIDGFSWRIIIEDLQSIFKAYINQNKPLLASKTLSFKAWSEKLRQTKIFDSEINFWKSTCLEGSGKFPALTKVPFEILELNETLDVNLTKLLLGEVHTAFNTQTNDILLMSLARSLTAIHGHENSLIYLEGHGRESIFEDVDISRTVGWFTSLYPVILKTQKSLAFGNQIKHFKEDLRKTPHNGLGYGVLKYQKNIAELKGNIAPILSFNYLGQFDDGHTDAEIRVSQAKTGPTIANHLLLTTGVEVNCFVRNGILEVKLSVSNQKLSLESARNLLDGFIANLKETIEFCIKTDEGGITPSDIDFDEFDIDTLDNVLENL
jgi:bacitracin synthase 3